MLPLASIQSITGNDTVIAEEADEESPVGTTMSEIKSNLSQQSEKAFWRESQKHRHQPASDAEKYILPRASGFKGHSSCIHLTS